MNDALITFIYVDDLERAAAFYGQALGLELVLDQAHCRIFAVSQSGYVGICENRDRPTTPQGVIITLVRDDVDAFCSLLADRGVPFEAAPAHNDRFAIYHAFVRDPDGHLIEIQRFDDPNWAG